MTWRRVDPYFARRIQLAAFIIGFFFGLDYLFTPCGSSTALTYLERSVFPLWAWGAAIMAASLAGFFTEWRVLGNDHPLLNTEARKRWGWVSTGAHIVLFAAFVVLTLSSGIDIVTRWRGTGQLYGWRTALMWGGYAYVTWQFIPRLGMKQ